MTHAYQTYDACTSASRIAAWLSALAARLHSATAACSFCAVVPDPNSSTSDGMPPASRIAARSRPGAVPHAPCDARHAALSLSMLLFSYGVTNAVPFFEPPLAPLHAFLFPVCLSFFTGPLLRAAAGAHRRAALRPDQLPPPRRPLPRRPLPRPRRDRERERRGGGGVAPPSRAARPRRLDPAATWRADRPRTDCRLCAGDDGGRDLLHRHLPRRAVERAGRAVCMPPAGAGQQ